MTHARGLIAIIAIAVFAAPMVMAGTGEVPPEVVEEYYECMERHDLDAIQDLIWYHHNVERIDARVYGLPKDDFDDRSALTIEERLDFRQRRAGDEMATSGDVQYPHFLRKALDHFYEKSGERRDCSEILQGAGVEPAEAKEVGSGWGSEFRITDADIFDRGEPHVAVDYANPGRIIFTTVPSGGGTEESDYVASTEDYGQTWWYGQTGLNAGMDWECDPVSYYQHSTGNVYHAKLACVAGTGCGQARARMRYSEDNGVRWQDCAASPGVQNTEDREWIVVDNTATSPCYGNIYVTYHAVNLEKVVRSVDNCETFTDRRLLTGVYNAIGPDLAVAADGYAYVAWHNYGNQGQAFKLSGSPDCGVTWTAPGAVIVKARYGNTSNNVPAVCQRGMTPQPMIDVDRAPQSDFYGRLYYAMFDMSESGCSTQGAWSCSTWDSNWDNTCNFDVFLSYSDDNGQTWSTPANVTAGDGNQVDHFLGFMRVDATDGSLWLGYHRSRLAPTAVQDRQRTYFFVTRSTDGGASWETPFQASDTEGAERESGANSFELGDYNSIDVFAGVAWPAWIGRRFDGGNYIEEDLLTRKICSEPAHWSERSPIFAAPATRADGGATLVTVTWDAPDIYWGDGGEDPASRKYQLWVDGGLAEDNIPWTATSTTYDPDDGSTYTYVIRAVNQCGLTKDYAPDSAAVCANNPQSVDVTPNGPLTVCTGTGQGLTATPSPGGTYDYQWYEDGSPVGSNSGTYTASNAGTHSYFAEAGHSSCADAVREPLSTVVTWQVEPIFGGVETATSAGNVNCGVQLGWSAATAVCSGPISYDVYRGEDEDFVPAPVNLVATGVTGTSHGDFNDLYQGTEYFYVVRANDDGMAAGEANAVVVAGVAYGESPTVVLDDDFEGGNLGWVFEKGVPPATTGDFVIGDPVGTTGNYGWPFQPEDDHTPGAGVNCLYSAENPNGNAGVADIDSGEVMATSPVIDGSEFGGLVLDLWRWFANEDSGDAGDYYFLEVSNDGGGSWTTLENLPGSVTDANRWIHVTFNLEDFVALTSDMHVRVRAADGTGDNGDLVELAIDDVTITGYGGCLSTTEATIFADGFESGDTSGWSATIP